MVTDNTTSNDAALEILKRLEPAIAGLAARLTNIESRLTAIEADVVSLKVDIANLQGRVGELPTNLQMLMAIVATVFSVAGIMLATLTYARTLSAAP